MKRALWATAGILVALAANSALGGSPRPSLAQFIGLEPAGPAGCGCEMARPAPLLEPTCGAPPVWEPKCCAPPPVCEPQCCPPPPCEPTCCAPPACQPACEPCCQPCCEEESLFDRLGRMVFGRRVQTDPCGYSLWPCVGQCCDECQAPHAPHGYGPPPEVLDPRMFSHPPDELVDPFEDDPRQAPRAPLVPSASRGGARTHSAIHRSAGW